MERTPEEIGRMMDALDCWQAALPYNWAVCPKGTVFPYFCTLLKGDRPEVKIRLLLLEGWQTFHDYVRTRLDANFGVYSTPMELPHFELVVLAKEPPRVFRHDPGYIPRALTDPERVIAAKVLWETYGFLMRVEESEPRLAMKFGDTQSMFARVEGADGSWSDAPLAVPPPPQYVERISFPKADIAKAKDLPLATEESVEVDFRILPQVMTREKRPRCAYALVAIDGKTGEKIVSDRVSVQRDGGLKELWESMPARFLSHLLARGRLPGEIRVRSGRVFRMLRPLCMQIPFKLSLHDRLPRLEEAFKV